MTTLQRYNALDTIATFHVWEHLRGQLTRQTEAAYRQSLHLMAPTLHAMICGIRVDLEAVEELRARFERENAFLESRLDFITRACLDNQVVNLASPAQVKWLFECFGADIDSSNRESLEQLAKADPELAPICNIILAWRDRAKMLTVLNPDLVDRDGRMRTFYKIAGTDTGRFSSSKNALSTKSRPKGMNMQNLKRDEKADKVQRASIRSVFIADPETRFLNIDLERADAWIVALEVFAATGDTAYLEAVESFDLHTTVSRFIWPDLGWNGDPEHDIALAKQFFYRQYDYRFMAKKAGHGSNYLGGARGLAVQMKIPFELAESAQTSYFRAFPAIPRWHTIRARELQTTGRLTNLFGRRRNFHSRLDSNATLREAVAFLGQSGTAEVINRAVLGIWNLYAQGLPVNFLAQVHDSVLIQIPDDLAVQTKLLPQILSVMSIPITVTSPSGQTLTRTIPLEVSSGWNWSAYSRLNPDGLVKKDGPSDIDARKRSHNPPKTPSRLMDRRLR